MAWGAGRSATMRSSCRRSTEALAKYAAMAAKSDDNLAMTA
jgi:hypothetical protein